jgi:predicted DNA-binding transcriptional regulator AlpA
MTESFTMTIPEVAKVLGLSRGLAYDLARRDALPIKVIRLGDKRMVVAKRSVDELLGNRTEAAHD